jgi:hypothetical protein
MGDSAILPWSTAKKVHIEEEKYYSRINFSNTNIINDGTI